MTPSPLETIWRAAEPPTWSPIQWESILSQARRARLASRLALLFQDRGWLGGVPQGPRTALENALKVALRKHDEVRWEVDRIAVALRNVPTPVVLLKGAAYVLADLPPGRARQFSDIDILVDRQQLKAVELGLFAAGWIAQKLDPYDERYYRDWMHELPPLQHVNRQTMLDVHHAITPPTSRFAVPGPSLLQRARRLDVDPRVAVLAPEDMVLHSAIHLLQDGDFSGGLRDLLDLDDLMRHFGANPGFWPELIDRAAELNLTAPLAQVWRELTRLFDTPTPDGAAATLRSAPSTMAARYLLPVLLPLVVRPDHPACDVWATGVARRLLYVRSHWLRMPPHMILPHLVRKAWMRSAALRSGKGKERPKIRIDL